MFPCLPTRGNIVAETKFASREAKMFPSLANSETFDVSLCFSLMFASVCPLWETWRNIGRKQWALSINTARPVKLLNETQNIWASDLSDRKIWITLE